MRTLLCVLCCVPWNLVGAGEADLGVNLNVPADWQTSLIFADAMKTSREWGTVATPWDQAAPKDAHGWPTGDAGVVVMSNIPSMSGTYRLFFTGQAVVSASHSPDVTVRNYVFDAATNTSTADVVAGPDASGIILQFSGTSGGVRDVVLMRPGHADETFTRAFVERLAPFSCIRFQMYLRMQGNPQAQWSDRTLPAHATQNRLLSGQPAGGCWEHAIELCNQLDKDIWINIPDQATDDYVLQLAGLLAQTLEAERKIYVEWSNEVWNADPLYVQTRRNAEAAAAEVAAGGSPLDYDGSTDPNQWAWRRIAKRGKECSDLFRSAFGTAAMMTRVRPVLASQIGRPEVLRQGLEFVAAVYGPPSDWFYAVSGAPYFGVGPGDPRTDLTVDQVLAEAEANLEEQIPALRVFTSWARYYNLALVAYEGAPNNYGDASLQAKLDAARDPRMADLLERSVNEWHAAGGQLFVYFDLCGRYSTWSSTGLTEDIAQATPRTEAIERVASASRPALSAGQVLPGTVEAAGFVTRSAGGYVGNDPAGGQYLGSQAEGAWANYLLRVPADGIYRMVPRVGSANITGRLELLVNSTSLETWDVPSTGGETLWSDLTPLDVFLTAGLQVVRLRFQRAGFGVRWLGIEEAPNAAPEILSLPTATPNPVALGVP